MRQDAYHHGFDVACEMMGLPRLLLLLPLVQIAATSVLDRRFSCNASSYYDCGKQIGRQAQALIQANVEAKPSQATLAKIAKWASTGDGKIRLAEYVAAQRKAFPDYLDEIRGLADGSGVSYDTLLRLNLESELDNEVGQSPPHADLSGFAAGTATHDQAGAQSGVGKGCTDFHVVSSRAWAHNEDGFSASYYRDTTYLVRSNITLPGKPSEVFVAFTYPGRLSGWAWGFNANGVALSINALTVPSPGNSSSRIGRLGVNFVARSLLGATDLADATTRASVGGHASGMHINLASFRESKQLSVETSPWGTTVLDLSTVRGDMYAHANQYLHTDRPRLGDYYSSVHRMARAQQWATWVDPPSDADDCLRFVSDTVDEEYPVYRSNTAKDPEINLVTCLFDLKAAKVSLFVGVLGRATIGSDRSTRYAKIRDPDAVLSFTELQGVMQGDDGTTTSNVAADNQPPSTYGSCYIGQMFGEGFVSFDQCTGAPGSFKCKLSSNASSSCSTTYCAGGHSHVGCVCGNCSLPIPAPAPAPAPGGTDFACACETGSGCECSRKPV
jgi:hypothetical protein